MMIKERQSYDREFKQKAVELSFAGGNAKEIAEELGIRPELLYRWRRDVGQNRVANMMGQPVYGLENPESSRL